MSIENENNLPVVDESIEDVGKSTSQYLLQHKSYVSYFLIATLIFEIFCAIFNINFYILPLFFLLAGYMVIQQRIQHEFMKQFAAANNFSYTLNGNTKGLDGELFRIGHNQAVADVICGTYLNCPITLFSYRYITGSGKNSRTYHATVFELNFGTKMPNILLKKKANFLNEPIFSESFLGETIKRKELQLEGNFNEYFNLEVEEGYEIEALQVFTPDFMEELIEKAKAFSMEIINDHIFIYNNKIISTKQELYDFYELAEYFVQKLGPVLARMKPSMQAMNDFHA